jgi:hypothetical protein
MDPSFFNCTCKFCGKVCHNHGVLKNHYRASSKRSCVELAPTLQPFIEVDDDEAMPQIDIDAPIDAPAEAVRTPVAPPKRIFSSLVCSASLFPHHSKHFCVTSLSLTAMYM